MWALFVLLALGQTESSSAARAQPLAPLGALFSSDDYPLDAAAREVEGTVGVRLVIDTGGRPVDCKIASSSGDPSLDATTCAILMQRAAFRPARNAQGETVVDSVNTRIRWLLPRRNEAFVGRPFSAYRAAAGISITNDGQFQCTYELNGTTRPAGECPIVQPEVIALLRRLRTTFQIVVVQTFTPQGGIIATPNVPYGELLSQTEAELEVSEGGEIINCDTTSQRVLEPLLPQPIDACTETKTMRFVPGAPGRRARVNISIYVGTRIAT